VKASVPTTSVRSEIIDDSGLGATLVALACDDKWAFRSWAPREQSHGLFQYPAMMVPQMQRELMMAMAADSGAVSVYDPFVGSGTTMAEAMLQGLDFLGSDINPLAVLLCRAKAGPFFTRALAAAGERVSARADASRTRTVALDWNGWEKWFRRDVAVHLSRLRQAIQAESRISTRRFLWVALAETVRLVSNSRTSTVKLHVRPKHEIDRKIDVAGMFARTFKRNLQRFKEHADALTEQGLLTQNGHYVGDVAIHLHDVCAGSCPGAAEEPYGMLVSSPPYGDNKSTVPYGQHAYLPLQWVDMHDIDECADERFLATTHAIDSMSLGAPTRGALETIVATRAISPTLDATLTALAELPRDRGLRVAAFWRDLESSLDYILAGLEPGGLMAWTVGNRRVGGEQIAMDEILDELLRNRGCERVTVLRREIPDCRKRMASRNSVTATMSAERVLVLRRSPRG
jgi:site-specific DNA-methyltransferase (cytosine-N4-specific)